MIYWKNTKIAMSVTVTTLPCEALRIVPQSPGKNLRLLTSSKVTGVDIFFGQGYEDDSDDENSNTQGVQEFDKYRWNLNARFRDDRSSSRLRPDTFDLINSRFLAEGIDANRWSSYIEELKLLLRPGGWLQMVELEFRFQSHAGRLRYTPQEPLFRWQGWYDATMREKNKDPRIGSQLGTYMRRAGFENVETLAIPLQIGRWNQSQSLVRNYFLSCSH